MNSFQPLTPETWAYLERLFGPRGACCGCWCMYWRLPHSQFDTQAGELNHLNLRALVDAGNVPGILAFSDGNPAGWCSLGPREEFPTLARSRILKPVDDIPVWSVVCFFIARAERHKGLTVELLKEAVSFAASRGARVIEGYPVEPKAGKSPDVFAYTGLSSAFLQAGFNEVARRSATRPIMRYYV
jgi:GNAT superfamily N-acetyltransferase